MTLQVVNKHIEDTYGETRTGDELIRWVDNCFERTRDKGTHREFLRLNMIKRLREEANPVKVLIKQLPEVFDSIQLVDGNQNYDAEYVKGEQEGYAEITFFKDGEFDFYQGQHLDKYGHAPITGRTTQNIFDAVNDENPIHGDVVYVANELENLRDGIIARITDKISKCYPDNTFLTVAVDSGSLTEERHWDNLIEQLREMVTIEKFTNIFIVSIFPERAVQL